jgi:hypothetical protein
VFWLVKVIDSLDPGFTYTFPMTTATMKNLSFDSAFSVVPRAPVFSEEDMQRIIDADKKESEAKYSKSVAINCSADKTRYYSYDSPTLSCSVRNTGNFPFSGIRFCFDKDCEVSDLMISQEKTFWRTITSPKSGKLMFSVEGADLSRSYFFDLDVLDEPMINITKIEYPSEMEFDIPFSVSFTLEKSSLSVPQDISVTFGGVGMEKTFELESLEGDKAYVFDMDGGDLSLDPNRFRIGVNYHDLNDKLDTASDELEIALVNVTFGQKVVIWTKGADRWLRNLFK